MRNIHDSASLHTQMADEARSPGGRGVAADRDVQGIIGAAKSTDCNAVHPGYGFRRSRPIYSFEKEGNGKGRLARSLP